MRLMKVRNVKTRETFFMASADKHLLGNPQAHIEVWERAQWTGCVFVENGVICRRSPLPKGRKFLGNYLEAVTEDKSDGG